MDIQLIINSVCEVKKLSSEDIFKVSRKLEIVQARQLCMALAYDFKAGSEPSIGKHFCKDHATVHHARNRVAMDCISSRPYKFDYEYIKRKIESQLTVEPVVIEDDMNYDYQYIL